METIFPYSSRGLLFLDNRRLRPWNPQAMDPVGSNSRIRLGVHLLEVTNRATLPRKFLVPHLCFVNIDGCLPKYSMKKGRVV